MQMSARHSMKGTIVCTSLCPAAPSCEPGRLGSFPGRGREAGARRLGSIPALGGRWDQEPGHLGSVLGWAGAGRLGSGPALGGGWGLVG